MLTLTVVFAVAFVTVMIGSIVMIQDLKEKLVHARDEIKASDSMRSTMNYSLSSVTRANTELQKELSELKARIPRPAGGAVVTNVAPEKKKKTRKETPVPEPVPPARSPHPLDL